MIKIFTVINFILLSCFCLAQEVMTDIDVVGNGFCRSRSMDLKSDTIYLQSSVLCIVEQDSSNCLAVSAHELDGTTNWSHVYEGRNQANENGISIHDNKLLVGCHGDVLNVNETSLFLYQFSLDGDLLRLDSFDLKNEIGNGKRVVTNGITTFDNYCYIYGWTELENDVGAGFIVKNEIGTSDFQSFYFETPIASSARHMWELSLTSDLNFRFIDNLSNVGELGNDRKKITKINPNGEKISETLSPDYMTSSDLLSVLTTMKNGNYVYENSSDKDDIFLFAPMVSQLICSDSLNNILWKYQFPFEFDQNRGDITITKIRESLSGDILGCGFRVRRGQGGDGSNDSYIFKISRFGELLWERFYTYKVDEDDFERSTLSDVRELPSGKIVGIGSHSTTNKTSLIIVDENGCLSETDCGISEFLSDVENEPNEFNFSIYPNPVEEVAHIEFAETNSGIITVANSHMQILSTEKFTNRENLIISFQNFQYGIYFILIENEEGKIQSQKVMHTKK